MREAYSKRGHPLLSTPLLGSLLLLLLLPFGGWGQEREVVFNQVTVSGQEAGISLEFADGDELELSFREGRILLDGDELGSYSRGDALETAWRELLGRAVATDNGGVARLLAEWSPPEGLEGEAGRTASALSERLDAAFRARDMEPGAAGPSLSPETERAILQSLVLQPERLQALAGLLAERSLRDAGVHVGEDVRVEEHEVVESSLLVVDGSLFIAGRVRGDVVVVSGEVTLGDQARIDGDLRWFGAEIRGDRGAVRGEILEVEPLVSRSEADLRAELEQTIRDSLREAVRAEQRPAAAPRAGRDRSRSVFRNVFGGLAGLFKTALAFGLLSACGVAILYFFPRHFEIVARTARNAPGQAMLVGLAGTVMAFPVWILGIVVLAVTIIGIPVMLLWLPAFPLAVSLAVGLGYLAVAWNVGRWFSQRRLDALEGLDTSRPVAQIGTGLVVLLVAFALAHFFQMGGSIFGIFQGLFMAVGVLVTIGVSMLGLGAVILSRAGREPRYAGESWGSAWEGSDPFGPEPDPFVSEPDEPFRPDPEEPFRPAPGPAPEPDPQDGSGDDEPGNGELDGRDPDGR